jgi:hypothetical protein
MANIRLEDSDSLLGSDVNEVYSQELLRRVNWAKKSKPRVIYYVLLALILFIVAALFHINLRIHKKHARKKSLALICQAKIMS